MQSPLFTEQQKQEIHDKAVLRQEKYLKAKQEERPLITGIFRANAS